MWSKHGKTVSRVFWMLLNALSALFDERTWFEDNDQEIQTLLDQMHRQHTAWINDKNSVSKKSTYQRTKQLAQARLRSMKDSWWRQKADELQMAADRKDSKNFFDGLKAVFGPRSTGSTPIYSSIAVTGQSD